MGEFLNFVHQGYKYKLYVPGDYHVEKKYPLLVMLHGCGQNPDDFAAGTNMNEQAEKEKFLVLYPDMNHPLHPRDPAGYNPFGCWNWFLDKNQHRDEGHPKLIYEMIHEVKTKYNIDSNKIYAAGLSAGGSLACILGVTYPDVFSGIGICSGLAYDAANVFFLTDPMAEEATKRMEKGVPDPYECGNNAFQEMGKYKKKMRVIVFHGICDTTVHPINGLQVITQWAQTNFLIEGGTGLADVNPAMVKSDLINGKSYTRHVYHDRKDEPLLELWMIDQMGHTWSGGNPSGSYTDPTGPNATEIIWNFLNQSKQQTEGKRVDTSVKQLSKQQSVKLLPPPQDQSTDLPAIISVQQPDPNLIPHSVTPPVQAASEKSTEVIGKNQDESPSSTPRKNFLSTLLSKLMKKKT